MKRGASDDLERDTKRQRTREYKFLGTLAGEQRSYLKRHNGAYENIYNRKYKPFGATEELRKKLTQQGDNHFADGYINVGEEYSFTPIHLRDGRNFGFRDTSMQGGGYFLKLKKLDQSNKDINCFAYALSTFGEKLEVISGEKMEVIMNSVGQKIDHIVQKYFEPVDDEPNDGDLVIYNSTKEIKLPQGGKSIYSNETTHAGIYRKTKPNWNSPCGGSVESKWGWLANPYVFGHDIFFTPYFYGNRAEFYRIKSIECEKQSLLSKIEEVKVIHPNTNQNDEGINGVYILQDNIAPTDIEHESKIKIEAETKIGDQIRKLK
ncbi:MAG: hypothetical protein JSS07_03400 [Proteobacteria bacterium]|nr:hypothetical protein [Pseudomonadota bacterium]